MIFSLTIALVDDNGTTYDADETRDTLLRDLDALMPSKDPRYVRYTEPFTIATGTGIDTFTGETEPILVIQGTTTLDYPRICTIVARIADDMNQRGFGLLTNTTKPDSTYVLTDHYI